MLVLAFLPHGQSLLLALLPGSVRALVVFLCSFFCVVVSVGLGPSVGAAFVSVLACLKLLFWWVHF